MNIPTKQQPRVTVADGCISVCRGHEVYDASRIFFLGCVDGPLVEVRSLGQNLLMRIEYAAQLVEALQAVLREPVAAPGANDAEIAALGFQEISR